MLVQQFVLQADSQEKGYGIGNTKIDVYGKKGSNKIAGHGD